MKERPWVIVAALAATAFLSAPLVVRLPAPGPSSLGALQPLARLVAIALPMLVAAACYRMETRLEGAEKTCLFALAGFLTLALNHLHYLMVDSATTLFTVSNDVLQRQMHEQILNRTPAGLPHSYRFLADTTIRWLEYATGDFAQARLVFRHVSVFLLIYATYTYARGHVGHPAALVTLLLYSVVYPFTIIRYSGQPIDPPSHLSFVVSYIFLERGQFIYFLLTLVIGSLAKETILAMAGFYVLFHRRERGYLAKTAVLTLLVPTTYLGVRASVLRGMPGYREVSGTTLDHLWTNLRSEAWPPVTMLTLGLFLPFFLLAPRTIAPALRNLVLYLFPVLLVSSLLFSWLGETRNWVPMVVPLAVIAAGVIVGDYGSAAASENPKT